MKTLFKRIQFCYAWQWRKSRRTRILKNLLCDARGGLVMLMATIVCMLLIPVVVIKDFLFLPLFTAIFYGERVAKVMNDLASTNEETST